MINGFWQGYVQTLPGNLLDQVPEYVDTVTLFVAAPSPESTVSTNYLCKVYPEAQQQGWVKTLQSRGQKVLMSLMDTPSTHWNQVDIDAFVASVKNTVMSSGEGNWNLQGVDIDLESGMPDEVWVETFTTLIQKLRAELGPSAIITADAFTLGPYETAVLTATKDQLSWVNTMGYFWPADEMERSAQQYAQILGGINKVAIGVGIGYRGGNSTPLSEVEEVSAYAQQQGLKGIMAFALNNDNTQTSGDPAQWGYVSAIQSNLRATAKKTAALSHSCLLL